MGGGEQGKGKGVREGLGEGYAVQEEGKVI